MITILSGLTAGFLHVLSGPDHLAAVAPLSMMRQKRAWMVGLRWGLGHASGVVMVGILAYFFREFITAHWFLAGSERVVGIALICIGLWGVRKALKNRVHVHEHAHEGNPHQHIHVHAPANAHPPTESNPHRHTHLAFVVGTLHGLAGSSHLLGVVPTLAMPTRAMAIAYLLSFGIGTILAMGSFSSMMDWLARKSAYRGAQAYRLVTAGFSVVAIGVGCFWLITA